MNLTRLILILLFSACCEQDLEIPNEYFNNHWNCVEENTLHFYIENNIVTSLFHEREDQYKISLFSFYQNELYFIAEQINYNPKLPIQYIITCRLISRDSLIADVNMIYDQENIIVVQSFVTNFKNSMKTRFN